MERVEVISSTTIKRASDNNQNSAEIIDLTPWDLQFLPVETIQKGLLFRNEKPTPNQIQHLQRSLSATLAFFPTFAGRLAMLRHPDDTVSFHIVCNNSGVLFVHAVAHNTNLSDVLLPKYVPPAVHSFFALNAVKNHQGASQPLLAVQVTELVDAIFIAFTVNHVVSDGKSLWHFVNSWAQLSRGSLHISKFPVFEPYFPDGIDRPIRFPFTMEQQQQSPNLKPQPLPERVFRFGKDKIAKLKSKANAEANTNTISSLQSLLTLVWRSVVRSQLVGPQEKVTYVLLIGARPRLVPPLPEDYFGNAAIVARVTMKAGELLQGGLGMGALEMSKVVSLYSHEKIKDNYESWVRSPVLLNIDTNIAASNSLATSSSPRFNIYGNDFGWGKPVAVRSGVANKSKGKISVFGGAEEGSIDIEVCLPYEILEAMGNDPEFMDAVSI